MSKIDEFSRLLGSIESKLEGLAEKVDENREEADRRHKENKENLERIDGKLDTLAMDATQDRAVTSQHIAAATLDRAAVRKELDEHDGRLKPLETFHGKVGAILTIAVPLISAIVWLVWSGIAWVLSLIDLKAIFGRIFH